MLKISFSGGQGSGKTSLLEEGKKILGLKSCVESIEDLSKKNPFGVNGTSNFIGKFYCMTKQINEENLKARSSPDILLCDNSILDYWIRWKNFADRLENQRSLKEKDLVMKEIYFFWIKTYDLIFHVRVDPKTLEKRNRKQNITAPETDHLKMIDDLYTRYTRNEQMKVIEVWNNGSVDESTQHILKTISDFIKN